MADPSVFERVVYTDGGLAPDEISERLVTSIDAQIWGQGFDAPIFANEFRVMRQSLVKDAHLKLILDLGGQRFDAIFFRRTENLPAKVRLACRPGITGLWQVSGRSDLGYDERVALDATYIKYRSFWGDVVILWKTIGVVLMKKGAY